MNPSLIFSVFFIIVGLITLLASIANWDFFFEHNKAQSFLKKFGKNGARIVYGILGALILGLGIMLILGTIKI